MTSLEMKRSGGEIVSQNTYWLAGEDSDYRALARLPAASLNLHSAVHRDGNESVIDLTLTNPDKVAALATKATLVDLPTGARILPAYLSDNDITILPGEVVRVTIRVPARKTKMKINVGGWNVHESGVEVMAAGDGH